MEKAKILAAKSLLKAKESLKDNNDKIKVDIINEIDKEINEIKNLKVDEVEEPEIIPANPVYILIYRF